MTHAKIDKIDFEDVTGRFSSWDHYITTCKASDFYTPLKQVVKVNVNDSIKTVLSAMFAYKLRGLPVYDPDQSKYRAFVDCYDIMAFILNVRETALNNENAKQNQIALSHEIAELDIPIIEAMNYGQNNFMFMLPEETLLREMIYVMGQGAKHRVWIYHKDKDLGSGLVTQAKLLQLLQQDLSHFPDIANKTLEELGLNNRHDIVCTGRDKLVLEGFKLMLSNDVQTLAILNKEGKVENQFSSNDIKYMALFGDFFENLEIKIGEYLTKVDSYVNRPKECPTCSASDTLIAVINRLVFRRQHRLFIAEDGKPVGVISAGDILRSIWPFCDQ